MPNTTLCVDDTTLANWVNETAPRVNPLTLLNLMGHAFTLQHTILVQQLIEAQYTQTLARLIEKKIIDVNAYYFFMVEEKKYVKLTPLMIAAKQDRVEVVKFLVQQGADISMSDPTKDANVLMMAFMNPSLFGWILGLAQERNQLESMLLCGTHSQTTVTPPLYKRSPDENNIDSYTLLLDYSVLLFEQHPVMANKVLANIVARYLLDPVNFEQEVSPLLQHRCFKPAQQFKEKFRGSKTPLSHPNEDKVKPSPLINQQSAEAKIVYLMIAFRKLLADRDSYQPYLALIESDLQKAVAAEQQTLVFDELRQQQNYSRIYIDDILFPIPHAYYQKAKKNSLLMRVLQKRLQQYHFAQHVERWSGYIPTQRANTTLSHGVIFTESQYGTGLFHGKFSHAIQLCLLGEFMKNHPELTAYTNEAGELMHLTLSQAVQLMVTLNTPGSDHKWWNRTIDFRLRPQSSLGDPFQLHSELMFNDCYPLLSAYLRDSFCGGYLDLLKAFNRTSTHAFTPDTFAELIAKSEIGNFFFTYYLYHAAAADYGVMSDENNTAPTKHNLLFFKPMSRENPTESGYLITEKQYDDLEITLTPFPKQHNNKRG